MADFVEEVGEQLRLVTRLFEGPRLRATDGLTKPKTIEEVLAQSERKHHFGHRRILSGWAFRASEKAG